MQKTVRVFLLVVAVTLSTLPLSLAQSTGTGTGTVVGTVSDRSGAVLPDAQVTLTDSATGSSRTATTNGTGGYVFVAVSPSRYKITIRKDGFATVESSAQVRVGQTTTLNVALQVGTASTVVEVSAAAVELQTLNATIGNTVGVDTLQSLPSLGRDVSSFVTMQPESAPTAA